MRSILIFVLIIISTSVLGQFTGTTKCGDIYSHKDECEKSLGEECAPFKGGYCQAYDVITVSEQVDDYDAPIFSEEDEVELCNSQEECYKLIENKKCKKGRAYISEKFERLYCSEFLGYEKKTVERKEFVENAAKLDKIIKDREKAEKDEKDKLAAKEKAKEDIKKRDLSKLKTIDDVKDVLGEMRLLLQE